MTNRGKDNSLVPVEGEILPAGTVSRMPAAVYPQMSLPDTGMRGVAAILYRWGFGHIAKAIEAQTAVEVAMEKLHDAQGRRADAEGRSLNLALIRETARKKLFYSLMTEAETAQHNYEMAALQRQSELSAKKREVRVAEELDKQRSVQKVAKARTDTTIARSEQSAAGRIKKADIDKLFFDSLSARHKALALEADAFAQAELANAHRILKDAEASPAAPAEDFPLNEFRAFLTDFENVLKPRGISQADDDLLNQMRAFIEGRGAT